jgi:hypothetical protein
MMLKILPSIMLRDPDEDYIRGFITRPGEHECFSRNLRTMKTKFKPGFSMVTALVKSEAVFSSSRI